jgi:hypothetical protein
MVASQQKSKEMNNRDATINTTHKTKEMSNREPTINTTPKTKEMGKIGTPP